MSSLSLGSGLLLFGITQAQFTGPSFPTPWGSPLATALVLIGRRTVRSPHLSVSPALLANRVYRTVFSPY
ncbi:hypothetical protein BJF79_22285 [Actinomadura sp. CNU-125]|uniref:hypothetical protein n=1 Tax=Actinomadura sp. CNU-125 TaxID=1904961 RepID=UPI000960C6F5|nr:hypothetical protein [Actinomadura sp. CNU-125]OLT12466.1 hypothetical protein BJF79_22285 [Actinomadura sp. CNU-125]